eukprot:5974141-Amphidinium_carterae.1
MTADSRTSSRSMSCRGACIQPSSLRLLTAPPEERCHAAMRGHRPEQATDLQKPGSLQPSINEVCNTYPTTKNFATAWSTARNNIYTSLTISMHSSLNSVLGESMC